MNPIYDINIADCNSAGIQHEAGKLGITHMRALGAGQYEGREGADNKVAFFALPNPAGWEFNVANTNGDPVWEENDHAVFAELAEACGVTL